MLADGQQSGGCGRLNAGSISAVVPQDRNVPGRVGILNLAAPHDRKRCADAAEKEIASGGLSRRNDGARRRNRWTKKRHWSAGFALERRGGPRQFGTLRGEIAAGVPDGVRAPRRSRLRTQRDCRNYGLLG